MATPLLTAARQAVAQAIADWPTLVGLFRRRYLFEDDPGGLAGDPSPSMGDLPAVGIEPSARLTQTSYLEAICVNLFEVSQ